MKRILMIAFSDIKNDPRVYRHINFIKDYYKVVAIGYKNPEISGVDFIKTEIREESIFDKFERAFFLKIKEYEKYYWDKYDFTNVFRELKNEMFDLIIANDIDTLPLAFKIKGKAKVVFDAHEYFPKEFEESLYWRFFFQKYKEYLCKKYIPQVDVMITVGDRIAKEYFINYGIRPFVISNAANYIDSLLPVDNRRSGIIKFVHFGYALESRKIELMIRTFKLLDKSYELYLYLKPQSNRYYEKIKKMVKVTENVFLFDPIPYAEVIKTMNVYDLGFYILPTNNFNNANALPNKIFEFIQARLGIISGPSPEISNLVKKYGLGLITEDFTPEAAANVINKINYEDVWQFKNNAHKFAYELSAEKNKLEYLKIIENII
ncbi:MAG: hypothetical protein NC917_04525 [Candidatus Omnitrophica bacterium]|nr:hypothetical protein [Candidatus Omnitrophota bacterium]